MAVTYNWIVTNMQTKPQDGHDDVVFNVVWRCIGQETVGDVTTNGLFNGSAVLDTSDLTSFTAFADLTKDQVVGWVKSTLDASGEMTSADVEADVAAQIAKKQSSQVSNKRPPWVTTD